MTYDEIIAYLWKRARYAVKSLSRDDIFETHGALKMAVNLGAVKWEDVRDIDQLLIRDTLNNPKVLHKLT